MKIYRLFAFFLIFALLLAACSPSATVPVQPATPASQVLTTVKACYTGISGTQTTVPYAFEKGLFKKYGLDVSLAYIAGPQSSTAALLTGNVDICQSTGSPVVNAVIAKQDLVMIAGIFNLFPASIMVRPEIKSVADLKGKAIGINEIGGTTDAITRYVIKQKGLDAAKDVTFVTIGDTPARIAALDAGKVSAAVLIPPGPLTASKKGYVELINMAQLQIPYQHTGIVTTRKYIANHRDLTVRFMKAVVEAMAQMRKDPEGTRIVMAKYNKLDPVADAVALDNAYQELILKDMADIPYPSTAGIQFLIDSAAEINPDASKITPDEVMDVSILKELETSGFISSIQK